MVAAVDITVESLQSQIAERDTKILYLEEQLDWLKRQIFGKKSERVVDLDPKQLTFDGFENISQPKGETQYIPAHKRKKRKTTGEDAIKLPPDLPSS
jgi:hypothetical protein